MKKRLLFFIYILLILLSIPQVFAHEQLDDGWHVVVKNDESERGKTWENQAKEWGYYENGVEVMRYSKLTGAHRGWGEAPENSLASIRLNREKGYFTFETDIRFTKDNVPVLLHDATINSLARNNDLSVIEESKKINELTFEEVRNNYIFNIDRLNHTSATVLEGYSNNRITTFEEMLDYVKANKMYVNIELKTGTKAQIESLVKMTQDKNMHNYVRWLSFSTNLLKYVRDYDDDEFLHVLKSSSCDENKVYFCGEDVDYFWNKLKTENNMLYIAGATFKYANLSIVDLPKNYETNLPEKDVKNPIPMGKLTISEKSKNMIIESSSTITYSYLGDGEVKCISSDETKLTCTIDKENHIIQLKSIGEEETKATVNIYATQGILYSATGDNTISVTIETEYHNILRHIKDIQIEGYNLQFDANKNTYKLKIKNEKELKIGVSFDLDVGVYEIIGNKDLKNGSVISVYILNSRGDRLLTYTIEIEKEDEHIEEVVEAPDTLKNPSLITGIVSIILILVGLTLIQNTLFSSKKTS